MDNLVLKQIETKERNIFIFEDITDILANDIYKACDNIIKADNEIIKNNENEIKKLYNDIEFDFSNRKYKPDVNIYLNTFGGYCYNGFSIINAIKRLNKHCKVNIIATGCCMSMGVPILLAVPLEQRFCYEYTTFMIHQLSGASFGMVKDMEDSVKESKRLNDILFNILLKNTTITQEELENNFNKKEDWYLTVDEALKYKIVSKII